MLQLIAKLFGSKSEKDIKRIMPLVESTKREGERMKPLSNDELRSETASVQAFINEKLKPIDDQLAGLHKHIHDHPELDLHEKEAIFNQIDQIEKDRNQSLELVLMKVLQRAFAIVRETARRFKENEIVEVTASDKDRLFAQRFENIKIT